MKSFIIFPQTAWTSAGLGFAGIHHLSQALLKSGVKCKAQREYQAIIFEFEELREEVLELVSKELPDGYEIPIVFNGQCMIVSNDTTVLCNADDDKFQRLLRDAHLQVTSQEEMEDELTKLPLNEINKMCDIFAHVEGAVLPLTEFDIEKILASIAIDKTYKHKLAGILVDIKTIWFALQYDLSQMSRNASEFIEQNYMFYGSSTLRFSQEEIDYTKRFKRYMYINNAIVRIRALWEKLIGLAILLECPDRFDEILKAKRVRATFVKNFRDARNPITRSIWDRIHSIDPFEERFRTPELHKIGRTIGWAAQETLGEETNRLLAHCNDLNRLLREMLKSLES
ncbi:MAG TPA: hypothetical protein VFZ66_28050 [Herpetosiphonaceae bacterium]